MSIVTLKRKIQAQYKNMSVDSKTGFSLNGTHRNQGYVGQTMLSRSFPKTPMKGNVMKGHGGCCGKYPKNNVTPFEILAINDSNVVKSSTLSNTGMIRTHYRWIWRPQPYSSTKKDTTHSSNPQSDYITNLSIKTSSIDTSSCIDNSNSNSSCTICTNLPREALPKQNISAQITQTRNPGNFVKENITRPENNNPILGIAGGNYVNKTYTSTDYLMKLNRDCNHNNVQNLNVNLNKTPLIGGSRTY